jgi:hypothetical protein
MVIWGIFMGLRYGLRPYAPLVPGYLQSEDARHFFIKSSSGRMAQP